MQKNDKTMPVRLILGWCMMLLGQWIGKWNAFEDQDFLCGTLLGAAMVLMIQAIYLTARQVAQTKK